MTTPGARAEVERYGILRCLAIDQHAKSAPARHHRRHRKAAR